MQKAGLAVRRVSVILAVILLIGGSTLPALADDPPACPPASGTTEPTGAAAATYSFNPSTCLWENDYYTWNPVTKVTTPKFPPTYTYNSSSGQYDYMVWLYNAAAGAYQAINLSATQPPAGAIVVGGPPATSTDSPSTPALNGASNPSSPSSSNTTVGNDLTANANSGDALVLANTTAGGATSGNALSMANIINLLGSGTGLSSGLATFNMDIAGDVNHDIIIDPSQLPSSANVTANNSPNNLSINSQASGQINNNIDLAAGSGNATVAYNTTAGDATTGSASTLADIINIINSIINSGQSFVGTINIKGNLNGDILMPDNSLSNLLASNSTPILNTDATDGNTVTANFSNTDINNNLNLGAKTGDAAVSNNTTAGNATTGNASTNITLLNLTGKQVVGDDALLVFVNVLGKWVGMIVNAPAGSTAAALGGNVTTNASQSGCNNANSSINNNVNLNSTSGNALVDHNTTAGNATSGDASASANVLNVACSNLNLSKWLGILFINVFGSWNGSFGIDTAAGNQTNEGSVTLADSVKTVKVFSLAPSHHSSSTNSFSLVPVASVDSPSDNSKGHSTVLSAATDNNTPGGTHHSVSLFWTAGSLFLLAGVLSTESAIARRKEARAKFRAYLHSITVEPLKRY